MKEKAALYFAAGAQEVWLCAPGGAMKFTTPGASRPLKASRLCPQFPTRVLLR